MTSNQDKTVLIVHAIDTEGPLYESLSATFERLDELFGIRGLPRSRATIERLRRREIDLGGKEDVVAETLSVHRLRHNDTWDKVEAMLERCMSEEFRHSMVDSFGGGWVYNWHCLDLVGYETNQRHRDLGYHNIFDRYREILDRYPGCPDGVHFHFHPMSTYRDAHRCATSYMNSPHLWEVLCRRIIERQWFPAVFRAGFQAERPDSNWFLEQWIPFDISNMAIDDPREFDAVIDFRNGRSGDWRRAPSDWSIYHPAHDDYQTPGNCRRWIARALNVLSRIASIDQREMDKAFARAQTGAPTVVGLCSHDYRDLAPEVDFVRGLIAESRKKYPDVQFKYCEGIEGFRRALGLNPSLADVLDLEVTLAKAPSDDVPNLTIETKRGEVFGPQPFLAIETMSRRFIHDNCDFSTTPGRWHYAFHHDTLPFEDVRRIGVAANDAYGHTAVKVIDTRR